MSKTGYFVNDDARRTRPVWMPKDLPEASQFRDETAQEAPAPAPDQDAAGDGDALAAGHPLNV